MNEWMQPFKENDEEPKTPPKLCIEEWGKNNESKHRIKVDFEFFIGVVVGIILGLLI